MILGNGIYARLFLEANSVAREALLEIDSMLSLSILTRAPELVSRQDSAQWTRLLTSINFHLCWAPESCLHGSTFASVEPRGALILGGWHGGCLGTRVHDSTV